MPYRQQAFVSDFCKMKTIIVVTAILSVVASEAPVSRYSARQSSPPASGPYNFSGWKPQGAQLNLPKYQTVPQQAYGQPDQAYGPPAPEETTTNTYDVEEQTEPIPQKGKPAKLSEQTNEKTYFVLVPQSEKIVLAQPLSQKLVYQVSDVPKAATLVTAPQVARFAQLQALPAQDTKTFYYPQPAAFQASYLQIY